jgi:hypothetical protein
MAGRPILQIGTPIWCFFGGCGLCGSRDRLLRPTTPHRGLIARPTPRDPANITEATGLTTDTTSDACRAALSDRSWRWAPRQRDAKSGARQAGAQQSANVRREPRLRLLSSQHLPIHAFASPRAAARSTARRSPRSSAGPFIADERRAFDEAVQGANVSDPTQRQLAADRRRGGRSRAEPDERGLRQTYCELAARRPLDDVGFPAAALEQPVHGHGNRGARNSCVLPG